MNLYRSVEFARDPTCLLWSRTLHTRQWGPPRWLRRPPRSSPCEWWRRTWTWDSSWLPAPSTQTACGCTQTPCWGLCCGDVKKCIFLCQKDCWGAGTAREMNCKAVHVALFIHSAFHCSWIWWNICACTCMCQCLYTHTHIQHIFQHGNLYLN